jgi:hypothetical protein
LSENYRKHVGLILPTRKVEIHNLYSQNFGAYKMKKGVVRAAFVMHGKEKKHVQNVTKRDHSKILDVDTRIILNN